MPMSQKLTSPKALFTTRTNQRCSGLLYQLGEPDDDNEVVSLGSGDGCVRGNTDLKSGCAAENDKFEN
jgi:hypothetical protein